MGPWAATVVVLTSTKANQTDRAVFAVMRTLDTRRRVLVPPIPNALAQGVTDNLAIVIQGECVEALDQNGTFAVGHLGRTTRLSLNG